MNLSDFPRARILFLPTPLVECKRLSAVLGGPTILMKRDDLTGLALGGNKTRKLEFLLGEAIDNACDVVVTGGAMQSNMCRQTSAAAASVGLECHLALGGEAPLFPEGNLLINLLCGATIHWCRDQTKGERIPQIANELRAKGRKPYVIPFGGSNATGALGLVAAIVEVQEQLAVKNQTLDAIILPSSSGGTHAGITVGLKFTGLSTKVIGIGIDREDPGEPSYESELAILANQVAVRLGSEARYTAKDFAMRYAYFGLGYGIIGDRERNAIRSVAQTEGILLDPVYTAKAMGGLIDLIDKREFVSGQTVLFWHTGGTPALFTHAKELFVHRGTEK